MTDTFDNIKTVWDNEPLKMAGTEKTYDYQVIVATSLARVGIREFAKGFFRIRVEPGAMTAHELTKMMGTLRREQGWKQPGDNDQMRFSKELTNDEPLFFEGLLQAVIDSIGVGKMKCFISLSAPEWAQALAKLANGDSIELVEFAEDGIAEQGGDESTDKTTM